MNRDFKGVWLPKEIYLHKGLTPTEKLLLAEINSFSINGVCFASNKHFADFLGVSVKHISAVINKLAKMGLVSVEITYKEDSKEVDKRFITPISFETYTSPDENGYPLPIEKEASPDRNAYPLPINTEVKEQEKEQLKEQGKEKKQTKKSASNSEYEKEFETLWAIYPKKAGKKLALSSYIKARKVKKYTYETIKLGLERYIRDLEISGRGRNKEHVLNGSTFFNQERFLDEYNVKGLKLKPTFNEYLRQKHGGGDFEQARDRKIVDLYPQDLPEPFQGF